MEIIYDHIVKGEEFTNQFNNIEIVTQLSIDRISRLELLCHVWNGPIIATILDEDRGNKQHEHEHEQKQSNTRIIAKNKIKELEKKIINFNGFHSLHVILVTRRKERRTNDIFTFLPYPINTLRNISLKNSKYEFVFLLDIDCIPSIDLYSSLIGTQEKLNSLRNICYQYLGAIVVPCFEPTIDSNRNLFQPFTHNDIRQEASSIPPDFLPFAVNEFELGHSATNFSYWINSNESSINGFQQYYQINYEEGFEPFIIMARVLTPLYCESLVGYGRNKILHIYHLFRLGISFWVIKSGCIVHLPHSISFDKIRLLGNQENKNTNILPSFPSTTVSTSNTTINHIENNSNTLGIQIGLLDEIKLIYNQYRNQATLNCSTWSIHEGNLIDNLNLNDFSNYSLLSAPIFNYNQARKFSQQDNYQVTGSSIVFFPISYKYLFNSLFLKYFENNEFDTTSCINFQTKKNPFEIPRLRNHDSFLSDLCSFHLIYKYPIFRKLRRYNINSNFNLINFDYQTSFWLVTHLSIDRFERLKAICSGWNGPIAAVIWIPSKISSIEKYQQLQKIHKFMNDEYNNNTSQYKCQLKLEILEYYPKQSFNKKQHLIDTNLYPFNALRGAALDIVEECEKMRIFDWKPENIIVFVIDVDMRPPIIFSSLLFQNNYENNPSNNKQYNNDNFVFHQIIQKCIEGNFIVFPALELKENEILHEQNNIETLLTTTNVNEFINTFKLLTDKLQPFHIKQYPQGHGATNTSLWIDTVQNYNFSNENNQNNNNLFCSLNYEEGWEPYGIINLKKILSSGGYHRSFVGRHKDKIEFIMRLHMLDVNFILYLHPTTFILDWLPHPPIVTNKEQELFHIIMEGLYRRSKRQLYHYKETITNFSKKTIELNLKLNSESKLELELESKSESIINKSNIINPRYPFDSLTHVLRSSKDMSSYQFWSTDVNIRVHSSQPIPNIRYDTPELGIFSIIQDETADLSYGRGISITFSIIIPQKVINQLGLHQLIKFPNNMNWESGSIGGILATCQDLKNTINSPISRIGNLDGRIKWNNQGNGKFQIIGIPTKCQDYHILIDREIQFHKDVWHKITFVFTLDGYIEGCIDDVVIYLAYYKNKLSKIDGIKISVISQQNYFYDNMIEELNDIKKIKQFDKKESSKKLIQSSSDPILLSNIIIRCSYQSIRHLESNLNNIISSNGSVNNIENQNNYYNDVILKERIELIIKNEITVIFCSKEWLSLGPSSLKEFLKLYQNIYKVIIVITPPISQKIIDQYNNILLDYNQSNCILHYAENFENTYKIRNTLARNICTKYTLHLNNDIFPVEGYSNWLEELIIFSELNPKYFAVMPFLLENNTQEQNRLHVWWKKCSLISYDPEIIHINETSNDNNNKNKNKRNNEKNLLNAVFDNLMIKTPIKKIQNEKDLSKLLFLEDHCILVQSINFQYQPLFDPSICYRREFFDLAWNIRTRGGEIGLAINSVVVYQRIQPLLTVDDLVYFINRRQDSYCFASQKYLNEKWNIQYRFDRWHEKQRFDSILNTKFSNEMIQKYNLYERYLPVPLILCFFTIVGANKFKFNNNICYKFDQIYTSISTIELLKYPFKDTVSIKFSQEIDPIKFSMNKNSIFLGNRLKSILESETLENYTSDGNQNFNSFISHPFSGYYLFKLSSNFLNESYTFYNDNNDDINNTSIWEKILISKGRIINECEDLKKLPSLIVGYVNPLTNYCSSIEMWIWIKFDHEIPIDINLMKKELPFTLLDKILPSLEYIASCLQLTLTSSTSSQGSHIWESFDLIRRELDHQNSNQEVLLLSYLFQLSFNPITIETIYSIESWLKNNLSNI